MNRRSSVGLALASLGIALTLSVAARAQEAFTAVWRAGSDAHYAWVSDWNGFEKKWEELSKQNLRLVDFDTTVVGGQRQWMGAWRAGSDGHYLFVGLDWNAFTKKWDELGKKNFRLTRMKTYLEGGQRKWAGVWREGSDGYYLFAGLDYTAFTKKWDELAKQNFRLVDMATYVEGGKRVFAGNFRQGSDPYALLIGLDWKSFTTQWADLSKKNLRLVDLETYVEGGQKKYAGVWRGGSDGHYLFGGLDPNGFKSKFDELSKQNMRVVRLAADNQCSTKGAPCCDDRCTGNLVCGADSTCHSPHVGKPMDIHWDETDANGFPLSPRWGIQEVLPPGKLPDAVGLCNMNQLHAWSAYAVNDDPAQLKGCTDDPVKIDIARWVASGPICWDGIFPGHVGWLMGGVTFDGHIFNSGGPATSAGFDHDYDFSFKPMDKNGNTITNLFDTGSVDHLGLETWDSDAFDNFTLPFWKTYTSQVKSGSAWSSSGFIAYNGAAPIIEGKRAIATGFVSLDCAHPGCHVELHPLLALAVQDEVGPTSEHWGFFASNWGGGGYCSGTNYVFDFPKEGPNQVYKFKLPWRKGAKSFTFNMSSLIHWDTNDGFQPIPATVHATPGDGVVIKLILANSGDHPIYEGEIALNWIMDPKMKSAPPKHHAPPAPKRLPRVEHDVFHKMLLGQLTPAQRKALPSIEEHHRARRHSPRFTTSKLSGPIAALAKTTAPTRARAVHDAAREARMKAHYEALRKAFGTEAKFRAAAQAVAAKLHIPPKQLQDMLKGK